MADFIENLINELADTVTSSMRRFSAFSLILFFLGTIYGLNLDRISGLTGLDHSLVLVIPLLLGILGYFVTEIAVVLFLILFIASMIIFI